MKKVLTTKDLQDILHIGRTKVYQLCNTDGFPAIKIGDQFRICEDELDKWLETYSGKEFKI